MSRVVFMLYLTSEGTEVIFDGVVMCLLIYFKIETKLSQQTQTIEGHVWR